MPGIDLTELINQGRVPKRTFILSVEVDSSLSVADMIRRGLYNNYKQALATIREDKFSVMWDKSPGRRRDVLVLPPYRNGLSFSEQCDAMRGNLLEHHVFPTLFAVGEQYPDIQRVFSLYALGFFQCENDCKLIPKLWGSGKIRRLSVLKCNLNRYKLSDGERCLAFIKYP